jgi:N-acetylmuramoyl-L-alanine amidase
VILRPRAHPSPNHGARRGCDRPDLVVLHHTVLPRQAALERLCDPAAEVSAHYLVDEAGATLRLVAEHRRAWHAGAGSWGSVRDVNSRSIGIELEGGPQSDFPEPQMAALEALLAEVLARWRIHPARVIAHSDMAPGRKDDPGPRFDWRRLARAGLSVWPKHGTAGGDLDPALQAFGYPAEVSPSLRLAAFRLRFRPGHAGAPDATDAALAADLARRFPVDRLERGD